MKAFGTRRHRVQWPVRKEWPVAGVENQKTTPAFLNSGQTGNSGQPATPATLATRERGVGALFADAEDVKMGRSANGMSSQPASRDKSRRRGSPR